MKITKIHYAKTVESQVMGAGVWEKIGVEGEVSENENIGNAIEEAKAFVQDAHFKSGALLPQTHPPTGDLYFNETTRKYEK